MGASLVPQTSWRTLAAWQNIYKTFIF